MKTEEDEAFDELAKKQGSWGGGFKAKRAMAKARVEEDDDAQVYKKPWAGLTQEDILILLDEHNLYGSKLVELIRATETKIKEKNT